MEDKGKKIKRWQEKNDSEHYKIHKEFRVVHRYIRFFHPVGILLNLVIIYFLFKWIGAKTIGIIFIIIFMIKEVGQIYMLSRIEKKILKPIEKLKVGVEQISKGNYEIRIENDIQNEIGILIDGIDRISESVIFEEYGTTYQDFIKKLNDIFYKLDWSDCKII